MNWKNEIPDFSKKGKDVKPHWVLDEIGASRFMTQSLLPPIRLRRPRAVGCAFCAAAFALSAAIAGGQVTPSPASLSRTSDWSSAGTQGDFIIRNFRFADGSLLPELRIHYTTLGSPRRNATGVVANAVLMLHGTTGNGRDFLTPAFAGELFASGQLLDSATHFIILPDGIGTGGSSKPSDRLRARFPHYGYADMVTAQYRLVTEQLHVNHLLLVLGTSMGAMHSWMWAELYPGFMDGVVPLASLPTQIAGRNEMVRWLAIQSVRSDPDWKEGNYTTQPHGLFGTLEVFFTMTSSPRYLQRLAPTRVSADAYIDSWVGTRLRTTDANDVIYQFEASADYDPSPTLEKIRAPLLAINSADDFVNPPELGIMERLIARVPHGRYVLLPVTDETRGHITYSFPHIWKPYLADFLKGITH